MWRSLRGNCGLYKKLEPGCINKQGLQKCKQRPILRHYSSSPTSSSGISGGQIVLGVVGTTILVGSGAILIAKFNPEVRSAIENNVPYSNYLLTAVIGEKKEDFKPIPPPKSPVKPLPESSTTKKGVTPVVPVPSPEINFKNEVLKSKSSDTGIVKSNETKSTETPVVKPDVKPETSSLTAETLKSQDSKDESFKATDKVSSEKPKEPVDEATKLQNRLTTDLLNQEQDIDQRYKDKKEYKEELLKQLRRQAVFHSEYLRALLEAQRNELKSEFEDIYKDKVAESKHEVQQELASSFAQLTAIKDELNAYVETHNQWTGAKKLWVACLALKRSLDDSPKPLAPVVERLKEAAGKDEFVNVIVQAIPEEAVNLGVYSRETLLERFFKLDNMCRRVVLIGDSGGNLFNYAVSYLQSLFIGSKNLFQTKAATDEPGEVPSDMFDILDHAKWYILQGNVENAVRYINLLRGTPRKVASDWLKDARIYLEVNQAADALLAHSGAKDVFSM